MSFGKSRKATNEMKKRMAEAGHGKPLLMLVALSMLLMVLLPACGKKGAPFLTKDGFVLRVDQLKGEKRNGLVLLEGVVRGQARETSEVAGCRVYRAWYPMDRPPCEGCPIEMRVLEEVKGKVVSRGRFKCELLDMDKEGLHFLEVKLIGRYGSVGPPSNRVKLEIGPLD